MYKRKEIIGDCTLYLGDARDILPTLGHIDCVVSDPPFGMGFVSSRRKLETKHKAIQNDESTDLLKWICNLEVSHSKYIFCRWDNLYDVPKPKSYCIWLKNNHSMGDLEHEHARKTESILFYAGQNHHFPNGRPNDIFKSSRTGNELHPTQKPVCLMTQIIQHTAGVVIDPFMGSGTTLVACAKTGRKGIGIEIDTEYFEIACQRVREAYMQPDLFI